MKDRGKILKIVKNPLGLKNFSIIMGFSRFYHIFRGKKLIRNQTIFLSRQIFNDFSHFPLDLNIQIREGTEIQCKNLNYRYKYLEGTDRKMLITVVSELSRFDMNKMLL